MFPNRVERVAEGIQEILAEIIHDDVKDPGIPAVFTITRVEVSRDLRVAKVHFSQLPDNAEAVAASTAALGRARGYLRRELGQRMPLKYLPTLEFLFDPSPGHAQRIEQILNELHRQSGVAPKHEPGEDEK